MIKTSRLPYFAPARDYQARTVDVNKAKKRANKHCLIGASSFFTAAFSLVRTHNLHQQEQASPSSSPNLAFKLFRKDSQHKKNPQAKMREIVSLLPSSTKTSGRVVFAHAPPELPHHDSQRDHQADHVFFQPTGSSPNRTMRKQSQTFLFAAVTDSALG